MRSSQKLRIPLHLGYARCHHISDLPLHHRDPFDRLLVSHAQAIRAYLLTTDELLVRYSELVRVVVLK